MVARREERGGSTVSRTSTKEERVAYGGNFADPEVGVDKVPADKVGTVGRGIGAMGTRWWERGRGMGGLKVEKRVGIVRKGVGDARGASLEDVHVVATIMGEGRPEIISAKAVGVPRRPGLGGLVYDDELPWGVEGVGKEIDGVSMDAMVCRDRGVAMKGAEVVQGKFYVRKELVPKIEGELGVNRGESSNHVVFEGADSSFSIISAMVGGRLELNSDGDRGGAKVGVEIRGKFVVDSKVGDSVAKGMEEGDSRRMSF